VTKINAMRVLLSDVIVNQHRRSLPFYISTGWYISINSSSYWHTYIYIAEAS
jgi:hypothetical protein